MKYTVEMGERSNEPRDFAPGDRVMVRAYTFRGIAGVDVIETGKGVYRMPFTAEVVRVVELVGEPPQLIIRPDNAQETFAVGMTRCCKVK